MTHTSYKLSKEAVKLFGEYACVNKDPAVELELFKMMGHKEGK